MPRNRKSTIKSLLFGLLFSILFTMAAMLVLAAALMFLRFSDGTLHITNQMVKLAAVIIGVCIAVPRGAERGLATGLELALIYAVTGYVSYVALGGHDAGFTAFLGELLLAAAVGSVTGVVRANMQMKKRRVSVPVKV